MDCKLDDVPTIMRIFENCMALPAFIDAQPLRQPTPNNGSAADPGAATAVKAGC